MAEPETHQDVNRRNGLAARRDCFADQADSVTADHDADSPDREIDVASILATAELRDSRADARDFAAQQRDMAANLDAFVRNVDDADAFTAREFARRDRLRSKADRVASELDRYLLIDMGQGGGERASGLTSRLAAAVERIQTDTLRQQATDSGSQQTYSRDPGEVDPACPDAPRPRQPSERSHPSHIL